MECDFCPSLINQEFTLTGGKCEHKFVLKKESDHVCNKWISVKDQLPELNEWILCNGKTYEPNTDDNVLLIGHYISNGEHKMFCSFYGPVIYDVTHWMPLPPMTDDK